MSALLLLVACLLLGALIGRAARPPPALAQSLNWWVLNIAFSALVLHLTPTLRFDRELWFLAASMWAVFLGAWALFATLGRALRWSRARVGALTLAGGFGATAFIGFPLIEALHGQEALKLALVADQLGCFLAVAVGGVIVAALYSGRRAEPAAIARRVLTFPPLVSLGVGAIVGVAGGWPDAVDAILQRLGATLIPMALFSIGLQLRLQFQSGQLGALALALGYKLALAPLAIWFVSIAIGVSDDIRTVAVLEAAMAPQITATILAEQNDLEPQLAVSILGIGIVLSLVTAPFVSYLIG
ncbi:MAG TPA: AEC family transporter [Steroidobacteraceae bacterium]|nr:AEC family transporter [Steroidobacteraceae bacterium]